MNFDVIRETLHVEWLPTGSAQGFQVDLISVAVWALREMRLHEPDRTQLEHNIKLDGRPFFVNNPVFKVYK